MKLPVLLMLLLLPVLGRAQCALTTNADNTLTITGYAGSNGVVLIPPAIGGLPVTSIGEYAFYDTCVANVLIPDSVTEIGEGAFYDCESLANITIGNNVTNVGDWTFAYCPDLRGVYCRGNSPSLGGDYVFTENLATFYYLPGATGWGHSFDGARLWKRLNQNPTNVQVWIGNIYEEKGGKILFHVLAGGEQICTFETNSVLDGGSSTTNVGYYYHQDSLTSSSALSSSSGSQTEVNVWYPFGRIQTASPQASFQVSRRFTGQVFDAESGLYYYNARYYDPELGRFIQPDDIISDYGNPQSYNRYSYCLNDPLTYNDPSGHDDTYTGASGRAMLQEEDSDAAGVVLRARQSATTTATVLRTAFEANPVVGAADGGIGLVSGHDAITGKQLTTGQRLEAGGGAVLAVTPFIFKAGKLVKVAADTEETVDAGKVLKSGWSAAVESDKFVLAEKQAVSGIIKDGKVIGIGDAALGHAELAKNLGIQLINGKLPPGMEGFLAQKLGGKIGVAGAGINGNGAFLTISDAGRKVAEAFFK